MARISVAAVLALVPAIAAAEIRLDLAPLPELLQLEPVYHLDRGRSWEKRTSGGIAANVGVGFGSRDGEIGLVAEGTLLVGKRLRRLTTAATSEVMADANALVRGRHTGWLEIRTDDHGPDEELTGIATITGSIEHGEARGLAPVHLGPGKRDHAAARADALLGLAPDKDDAVFGVLVQADASATRWHGAPLLDHAYRGAFGLGLAIAPFDGELPRGRVDILCARVEHATIRQAIRAAGAPLQDTQVRTIEVMTGMHELTGWIDHELLVVGTAQVGAVWLTADTFQDTFFKMQLGTHLKWRKGRAGRREVGFVWAREPGVTPDGQASATDWRLALVGSAEDARLALSARGGISWVTHHSGGTSNPDTLQRYGSHVDAFVKLAGGLEIGGYQALTFEPQVAGNPWSAAQRFVTEVGVLVRWRPSSY